MVYVAVLNALTPGLILFGSLKEDWSAFSYWVEQDGLVVLFSAACFLVVPALRKALLP